MRCALYARVSTTDQNCEMQLQELREYIARRGWKNGGGIRGHWVLRGQGKSPRSGPLMADAAQRKFDMHRRLQD